MLPKTIFSLSIFKRLFVISSYFFFTSCHEKLEDHLAKKPETESQEIDLSSFEKRVFCQNGEDGVLEKIFDLLGAPTRYYVEFGVQNGEECNTRNLRENHGWKGLLMDGGDENLSINLRKEFITAENINDLFAKYEVPDEFDLLSIDLDYNDFYIWKALNKRYKARVVVIEYNATHLPTEDRVVYYDQRGQWDLTNYFGVSLLALYRLGREKGYSLVYAENQGVNCFFIREDLLASLPYHFCHLNDVEALYKKPKYGSGPNGGHPADSLNRPYLDSNGEPVPQ